MTAAVMEELAQDTLAHVLHVANKAALAEGIKPSQSLISIKEEGDAWLVHYGRKDFLNVRGGDVLVYVNNSTTQVERVVLGQ